jgi:oxidase EvaA
VGYFRVHALDREVPKWDQPLIKLSQQGSVTLVAQEHDGVLRFLVRVSHEPGFANSAQLSATDQTHHAIKQNQNGVIATSVAKWSADPDRVQLSCVMSEEGSRFHWGINQYRILWVPSEESVPVDERFRWMTLGEITELKKISGVFTNEFRSALSLLVHFI